MGNSHYSIDEYQLFADLLGFGEEKKPTGFLGGGAQ
jgi:hypothetical protein